MLERIKTVEGKILVGQKVEMSAANNQTPALWQQFGPRQKEISNRLSPLRYAVQVYKGDVEEISFSTDTLFDMWAAVEVGNAEKIPAGMEVLQLEGGLYAVFLHKGLARDFPKTWQYIVGTWLPASGYALDGRPHFQVMGESYRLNDADAEEEVWIPLSPRE
jgi:AraC family transcriptional regulator